MDILFTNETTVTKRLLFEVSKKIYRTYHKKYRLFCFIFFLISLSFSLYSVLLYNWSLVVLFACLAFFFLFMFYGAYLLRSNQSWKNMQNLQGETPRLAYSFYDQQFEQRTNNSQSTFDYTQITGVLETENLYILMFYRQGLFLEKSGFLDGTAEAFLPFIREKCSNVKNCYSINNSKGSLLRKVLGWLFAVPSGLLLLMQLAYLLIGKRYGFEYIDDNILYYVNGAILLTAFLSLLLLVRKKKAVIAVSAACAILLAADFMAMQAFHLHFSTISIISVSPDYRHVLVLKQDTSNGKTVSYRNRIFLFARPGEQFPYTVDGPVKIQWLVSDVCAVTYTEPDQTAHQYIDTFGDRGSGISYYYVASALRGQWEMEGKNPTGKTLTADASGITITDGSTEVHYDQDSCVQVGTLALVLCKDGLPQWTVALNADCKIGNDDLIAPGGTITLCAVSMDKTAPMTFVNTSKPKIEVSSSPENSTQEKGSEIEKLLADELKKSPDLSGFQSRQDEVKVQSDSTNPFWIGRLVLEENTKQYAVNGIDVDVQINQLQILAGDENEFLIEMKTTQKSSDPHGSETGDLDLLYRIKKGNGVYLAVRIGYGIDGTVGLTKSAALQKQDTKGNADYHFFVPGVKP